MFPYIENAPTTPSRFAFTGNPIILRDDSSLAGQPVSGYPFTVYLGRETVYKGRFGYPYRINIAEVVKAFVPYIADPGNLGNSVLYLLESEVSIDGRAVYIHFDGEFDREFEFYALPGGISKQNLRLFAREQDADIFTERFLSRNANFFFTTRSAGWRIVIKETELYPLVFINDDDNGNISFHCKDHDAVLSYRLDKGIYAVDLDTLRKKIFIESGQLINEFDVYRGGEFACNIVIEEAPAVAERYRFKFRNSLGVFEIIDLPGSGSLSPDLDNEDAGYLNYSQVTDDYVNIVDRGDVSTQLSVNTVLSRADEYHFFMDFIGSDEVYLLDLYPDPVRVLPSIDELAVSPQTGSPIPVSLKFTFAEKDRLFAEDITSLLQAHKGRLFSQEFNNRFN